MSDIRLQPPFDPQLLEAIIAKRLAHGGGDLSLTAQWLLDLNDHDRMVETIRETWMASSLPLNRWADLITQVHAYTTDRGDCIWLDVALAGWEEHEALQQAPFPPATLETCGWNLRSPIPAIMRDVALSAPGLKLKDAAIIGAPQAYLEPLGEIRPFVKGTPLVLHGTKTELPLEFFIAEVAMDWEGNQFVLGSDDRLYYWDHATGATFRCKITLEELIFECFKNPERLLDDTFIGVKW